MPGTHTPRPGRGQLVPCLNVANHDGGAGIYEVWCHPADTRGFLSGGIQTVNGMPVSVQVVDRLAFADQLRISVVRGISTWMAEAA